MKFLKTCSIFIFLSTNAFAAEISTGNRSISSKQIDFVTHAGQLRIKNSEIQKIETTGNLKIKNSKVVNINHAGNMKSKNSEIDNIQNIGRVKLKNIKLKILKINGSLKIKDSKIETIECLDKCEINIEDSEIKEIKFKKEKGLIEVYDKSKIIKLTNCAILKEKNDSK